MADLCRGDSYKAVNPKLELVVGRLYPRILGKVPSLVDIAGEEIRWISLLLGKKRRETERPSRTRPKVDLHKARRKT